MTDEREGPVHYQVSVTGRQAAAFFLVLLAALGLSFFFGMKTGAAAKRGPEPLSALAAQSDIPVPTAAAGEGREKPTPTPTEAPIGFSMPAPEPTKEVAAKAEPPAKEEPKPVVKELAGPKAEAPADAKVPSAKAAAAAPREAAASKKAEEGPFWVQILVTKTAEKADSLAKKLKADGFRPDVSLVPGRKGLFRVRIGSYPDRARAEAAAKKVAKSEKLQTKPIVVPGT